MVTEDTPKLCAVEWTISCVQKKAEDLNLKGSELDIILCCWVYSLKFINLYIFVIYLFFSLSVLFTLFIYFCTVSKVCGSQLVLVDAAQEKSPNQEEGSY